jgi:hypothetical protein
MPRDQLGYLLLPEEDPGASSQLLQSSWQEKPTDCS